jgi:plastocyanin
MMPVIAAALVCASFNAAAAKGYQAWMLNQGVDGMMRFNPQLLRIAPGGSVHFTATDQG